MVDIYLKFHPPGAWLDGIRSRYSDGATLSELMAKDVGSDILPQWQAYEVQGVI